MYLSHPVRRMRDDPVPGETVALVVELDADADRDALASLVSDAGGTVNRALRFGGYAVTVPESAVSSLCESGLFVRIETADTLSLGLDPGTDSEP